MMGRMTKDDMGIIPRLCRDLLEAVFHNSNAAVLNNGINGGNALTALTPAPVIEVGYYEIYNEKIFDLLSPEENSVCRIREHAAEGVYVEGLRLEPVVRYADVSRVLEQGMMKRQTASTLMNATSSRSHAVFTIFIKQTLEIPLN